MSMILMAQAMKLKIGNSARKFVLIKLADNANDKGECWPSYQHIADHCELGRSTVKAHIEALAESGFIKKFERNNGKSSNKYVLTLEDGDQQERVKPNRSGNLAQPLTGSTADTPCTAADTPLAQPLIPEPVIEAIKEPITFMSPTGSACSVCNGYGTDPDNFRPDDKSMCPHCKGTGKEPTCNDGLQVVNSELTTGKPKTGYNRDSDEATGKRLSVYAEPPTKADKPKPKRNPKWQVLKNEIQANWPLIASADDYILTEWCKLRIRKGAKGSDIAHRFIEGQITILMQYGLTVSQILENAIIKEWRGIEADWFNCVKDAKRTGIIHTQPEEHWAEALRRGDYL